MFWRYEFDKIIEKDEYVPPTWRGKTFGGCWLISKAYFLSFTRSISHAWILGWYRKCDNKWVPERLASFASRCYMQEPRLTTFLSRISS
jgi:hypothetical protein